jgi:hypothetical protein
VIEPRRGTTPPSIALFAATIFLSAFLLFQIQPMISKYILPWFGSTPGVWATALVFFQCMLLAGYAYAHLIVSRLAWHRQAILHITLLALALFALPITPAESLKPIDADAPIGRILFILTLSVGAPFFLLSATAPLVQRWFALLHPGLSPYRLYALSNAGSLIALLSYPFVIERFVSLQMQTWIWSLGYGVFAAFCAYCGWGLYRSTLAGWEEDEALEAVAHGGRPATSDIGFWLALSACGSGLLVATTNQMSLDVAAVPFLWIVPLSLYLLSFILCFDSDRWYLRPLFAVLLPLVAINTVRVLYQGGELGIIDQIAGYSMALFVCCMCCHGELARMRPAPNHLTLFFLTTSAGGALGGMFVAMLAPALFVGFYEYHILVVACCLLMAVIWSVSLIRPGYESGNGRLARAAAMLSWGSALAVTLASVYYAFTPGTWYDDDSSSHLIATYAVWRAQMMQAIPFAIIALLLLLEVWRRRQRQSSARWWFSRQSIARLGVSTVLAAGVLSLVGSLSWQVREAERRMVDRDRNFYGVLAIKERNVGDYDHFLSLTHGRIRHGEQMQEHPTWPTSYYGPETGVGVAIRNHPARSQRHRQFRIGVVGLGVGTLAAYANAHIDPELPDASYARERPRDFPDYMRFYELNPLVVTWAQDRFTFLADARTRGGDIDVFEGDARIVLERQLQRGEAQRFDLLAIDAFSSDAIPLHLLTQQAFEAYLGHLQDDGILALHVTNRYVDLIPIVARLAEDAGMRAMYIENHEDDNRQVSSSDWILLTRNQGFLDTPAIYQDEEEMPPAGALWTDDFSSIFDVVEID